MQECGKQKVEAKRKEKENKFTVLIHYGLLFRLAFFYAARDDKQAAKSVEQCEEDEGESHVFAHTQSLPRAGLCAPLQWLAIVSAYTHKGKVTKG